MRIDSNGNVGIGQTTPSSKLDVTTTALGITQTNTSGLALVNTTAAALDAQQISPALRLRGQGWKTDATSASRPVDFRAFVRPIQGAANPTGGLDFQAAINDGAYSNLMTILSGGNVGIGTTTPSQTLHVAGTARITTSVAVTDDRTLCTIAASGEIELKDGACGTSALRYKENIEKLGYGLNEINLLKPIFFNYKNFDENYTMRTKRRIGFIAEEVLPIVPEVVIMTEDGQADSIDYAYLVSLLTRGVQELDQKIESVNSQFIEKMKQYLESVGLWVENGIAKVKIKFPA